MSEEILAILEQIEREKGIDKEILISAVESALVSAARSSFKSLRNAISPLTTPICDLRILASICLRFWRTRQND